jgi:hypothetical protein
MMKMQLGKFHSITPTSGSTDAKKINAALRKDLSQCNEDLSEQHTLREREEFNSGRA